jgi:uncharacterized protein YjbJ (UPF0337 family)
VRWRTDLAGVGEEARHPGPQGPFNRGSSMNKDQVEGTLKDAAGKLQQKTGELIGSTDQQGKGLVNQIKGKTQKLVGDVKEVVKDAKTK